MSKTILPIPLLIKREDIKAIRSKLALTQKELANLLNVSHKTVERWEISDKPITGSAVPLLRMLKEHPFLIEELRKLKKMSEKQE